MTFLTPLICAAGVTFLIYGGLCLSFLSMVKDFQQFGLERLRFLTGLLEVLGGSGLLVGLKWSPALSISPAGLSLLMLIAFGVRLRMRDSLIQSLPSLALMLANVYILIKSFQR
jgi:uncharacterized membrane protein